MKTDEAKILRKFCGAILEYRKQQPYKRCVRAAAERMKIDGMAEGVRAKLIEAIILNVINFREYPFDRLQRKFELPIAQNEFTTYKNQFCALLAEEAGFATETGIHAGRWSKQQVLDMLFSIADEANGRITGKDGAFNHQVAGVALKAIDQAVRLSGMCDPEKEPEAAEITLDSEADRMGA